MSELIESYREEYAIRLRDSGKMWDFLPNNINPLSNLDQATLRTWQKHFEAQGISYLVTEQTGKYDGYNRTRWTLWKEKRTWFDVLVVVKTHSLCIKHFPRKTIVVESRCFNIVSARSVVKLARRPTTSGFVNYHPKITSATNITNLVTPLL